MNGAWVAPHPHPTCRVPGWSHPPIRHSGGCSFRVLVGGVVEGYYRLAMEARPVAEQLGGVAEQSGHWTNFEWRPL